MATASPVLETAFSRLSPPSLPQPPFPPPQLCLPSASIPKPGSRSSQLLCPSERSTEPPPPLLWLPREFLASFHFQNAQLWVFRHCEPGRRFPHHPAGSSKCRVILSWCLPPSPPARGGAARIEPRRKTGFWKHPKGGRPEAKGVCLLSCTLQIDPGIPSPHLESKPGLKHLCCPVPAPPEPSPSRSLLATQPQFLPGAFPAKELPRAHLQGCVTAAVPVNANN